MIIEIKIIEEWGELISSFGKFEEKHFQELVGVATSENMMCLAFIDLPRDAYFNEIQCKDIRKELEVLKEYSKLNMNLLDSIGKATELVIKKSAYLKFEVVDRPLD